MINFVVYDPPPTTNDFITKMWFEPLTAYGRDHGIYIQPVRSLIDQRNVGVLLLEKHLTPELIVAMKNNGCRIFAFNCVDASYVCGRPSHYADEIDLIDRFFMLSGIQRTETSLDITIDSEFNVVIAPKPYLDEVNHRKYDRWRLDGKLLPLPHIPWDRFPVVPRLRFEDRKPGILFRGGNQFLRVLAFLFALRRGIANHDCSFLVNPYFKDDTNPSVRFCSSCRKEWKRNSQWYPLTDNGHHGDCASPALWGDGVPLDLSDQGAWNNRCPKSYYWLAGQFQKRHGPIDMTKLECALNARTALAPQHLKMVGQARFFGDLKLIFSIYTAQRFWEGAAMGTVNLLPERTNDQDFFPAINPGEHYVTFREDFSDLSADIEKDKFDNITENCRVLYEEWIRPTTYRTNTRLLKYIFERMDEAS